MPHMRKRVIESAILKSTRWSPIVGLIGGRQTGKSTLLRKFSASELSLDDPKTIDRLIDSGELALAHHKKPLLIDEAQKYPALFDLLKLKVDREKRPAQFLLTGSSRFSQKKGIRESLTGRIITWELLPLTLSEANENLMIDWSAHLQKSSPEKLLKSLKSRVWASPRMIETHLERGGLPGICFLRDPRQRKIALENHLDTLIERDVYTFAPLLIRPRVIRDLLVLIAKDEGFPSNHSAWARRLQISVPTVKRAIAALEAVFLIRSHGKTYFIEDLGIRRLLAENERPALTFVFSELKAQALYHKEAGFQLREYRTRGGAHVPFVLQSRDRAPLAFCISETSEMTPKNIASLRSFGSANPKSVLVVVHRGSEANILKTSLGRSRDLEILTLPLEWIC